MQVRGCLALVGIVALAGCYNPSSRNYRTYDLGSYGYGYSSSASRTTAHSQPSTGVDAAAVSSALEERAQRELAAASRAERWAAERAQLPVKAAVAELYGAYAQADAAAATALIASHPQLVTWDEAEADGRVAVNTTFERTPSRAYSQGEGFARVSLSLPRTTAASPALAVVIPPGTFGVLAETVGPHSDGGFEGERWVDPRQERRYGHWPAVQDLAFLRAGAVILSAKEPVVSLRVPVACASFEKKAPKPGMRFDLKRFPAGSDVERLLVELCAANAEQPEPAEVQIAVWLARNRISWGSFVKEGGTLGRLSTFSGNQPIRSRHAQGAATLLLRSGTDPRELGFFSDGEDTGPSDVPAAELLVPETAPAEELEPEESTEEAEELEPEQPVDEELEPKQEQPSELLTASA